MERVLGLNKVEFIQDQPSYRTFYNQAKGNPKNYPDLLDHLDTEYVILQGPLFTINFPNIWRKSFEAYKRKGVKVILLSSAFFRHNNEELESTIKFLKEFPPFLITTRDEVTFKKLQNSFDNVYNGIDSAFFVPKAYNPIKLDLAPYVVINFDRWPEPRISEESTAVDNNFSRRSFNWMNKTWNLEFPTFQMKMADKNKWCSYIASAFDFRTLSSTFDNLQVIRTEHRYTPHITFKIYKRPGAIVSDEPWTYFTVYANTSLTISDRVHACAMTLAYGNPAILFTASPRSLLFERVGATHIRSSVTQLDLSYLDDEREKQIDYLKQKIL